MAVVCLEENGVMALAVVEPKECLRIDMTVGIQRCGKIPAIEKLLTLPEPQLEELSSMVEGHSKMSMTQMAERVHQNWQLVSSTHARTLGLRSIYDVEADEVNADNAAVDAHGTGTEPSIVMADDGTSNIPAEPSDDILACIRQRRSLFPKNDYPRDGKPMDPVEKDTMSRLLDAAMWAPFHGPVPPWRFVVLGKRAMNEMQRFTLEYYDRNWETSGWSEHSDYLKWRKRTEEEIEGRWGPVCYMVAIVMRRQAGSKRMQEWEEMSATACAVQNMHIQACAEQGLACYWSSWHSMFRDSSEMKEFLEMDDEDRCLGFFMVARAKKSLRKDSRRRCQEGHVDWRID